MPTAQTPANRDGRIWAGLLTLYLVWGSTYLAIAVAVETIPPFLMAAVRFGLAGLILLTWSVARDKRSFVAPTPREWRDSAIVGALLIGGGMGLAAFSELTVPSGITALVIALMPAWIAVIGRFSFGERLPGLAVIGLVAGFVGIAILAAPSIVGGAGAFEPIGLTAVMISPICWATGSVFASHRATLPAKPLVATGAQMVIGAGVLLVMSLLTGEPGRLDVDAITARSVAAVVYLLVMGSLVAFTVYGWMIRVAPLPLVATYAYVNPIIALILGAILLGEPIDSRTVVAGVVIVAAVALIVTARGRMTAPAGARDDATSPAPSRSARPQPSATD
jgi:drug/metabolite transporter (DMT)-like permease